MTSGSGHAADTDARANRREAPTPTFPPLPLNG